MLRYQQPQIHLPIRRRVQFVKCRQPDCPTNGENSGGHWTRGQAPALNDDTSGIRAKPMVCTDGRVATESPYNAF